MTGKQNTQTRQRRAWLALLGFFATPAVSAATPDWSELEAEALRHFQALVQINSTDPPGTEQAMADYLVKALEAEDIEVRTFALEPHRPNVVARLRGNGTRKPLLLMAHTDTVNIDPAKWTHPPFSAAREAGYIYGRGTVDDKDKVTAALITLLTLKRLEVPLDRDVIFLAEAGEEGSTRVGIQFMVDQHLSEIDAEYCLAEGGGVVRKDGAVRYAGIQTVEKNPRAIELIARGTAGHGSVPLESNAIVHLSKALAKLGDWRTPIRLNETTRAYFQRLAEITPEAEAAHYRDILHPDPAVQQRADDYFRTTQPSLASIIRTSLSPNIVQGGYRVNVIPSEAKAIVDTRLEPSEDPEAFLEQVREIVDDPAISVAWAPRDLRPPGESRIDSEAFKVLEANVTKHYAAPTLPTMSTGATDMAYLRAKGIQCYGIGPAIDVEDGPKGFGAHSDQERILEDELKRFLRFNYDVVVELAGSR
jgi:acetylornithine deacetylase/succinyl-diaminopimelate desuccinylase-like protein